MTKEELKKSAQRHSMKIVKNSSAKGAYGLLLYTTCKVPELEDLMHRALSNIVVRRLDWFDGSMSYQIHCPDDWLDQSGWRE